MDPNPRFCELSYTQLTTCTLFEGLLSAYIMHRSFCQPGSWFLPINLLSKNGEAKKRNSTFYSSISHEKTESRIPSNRKCNLEYLKISELDAYRRHLAKEGGESGEAAAD